MVAALHLPIVDRPRTRADCESGGPFGARPCRFERCEFNLTHDGNRGARVGETCALDVIDGTGGASLSEIGGALRMSRERVRQIEAEALRKLHLECDRRGLDLERLIPGIGDRR